MVVSTTLIICGYVLLQYTTQQDIVTLDSPKLVILCLSLQKRTNCCVTPRCKLSVMLSLDQSDFYLLLYIFHRTSLLSLLYPPITAASCVWKPCCQQCFKVLPCQSRCGGQRRPAVAPGGLGSASPALCPGLDLDRHNKVIGAKRWSHVQSSWQWG